GSRLVAHFLLSWGKTGGKNYRTARLRGAKYRLRIWRVATHDTISKLALLASCFPDFDRYSTHFDHFIKRNRRRTARSNCFDKCVRACDVPFVLAPKTHRPETRPTPSP